MICIHTNRYANSHGEEPRGQRPWGFRVVSPSLTAPVTDEIFDADCCFYGWALRRLLAHLEQAGIINADVLVLP